MPSARYSREMIEAYVRQASGSKSAAMPSPSGQREIARLVDLNSAVVSAAPLRGSDDVFTGTPNGSSSARAYSSLFQRAAVAASVACINSTCRIWSSASMVRCWSDRACGATAASEKRRPA